MKVKTGPLPVRLPCAGGVTTIQVSGRLRGSVAVSVMLEGTFDGSGKVLSSVTGRAESTATVVVAVRVEAPFVVVSV